MPMTAAEKQKKYREKLKNQNPEKFEEMKRKAKERSAQHYQKKKSTYTEEDKQKLRQKWKEDRKKAKDEKNASQNEPSTSQASSKQEDDDSLIYHNIQRRIEHRLKQENLELRLRIDTLEKGFKNLQKKNRRQQQKMNKMQEEYENVLAKLATKQETEGIQLQELEEKTPTKKVAEFINNTIPNVETPKKEEIKKKVLEHYILTDSLKEQFKSANNAEKNILKKVLDNDIVKKYKQKSKIRKCLGLKHNLKNYNSQRVKSSLLKNKVERFFNKDDVSRATAGKKEYRTFKKIKHQKRYLVDKLSILHKKFILEESPISFSTFKKYRPFYVLSPKVKDCESCACIKHSNMQFLVDKLKFLNILKSNNLNEVVANFVCDFTSKDCMYNKCDVCLENKLCVDNEKLSNEASWFTWTTKEHEYEKQGEKKKIKKIVKIRKEGTLKDLLETFNSDLKKIKTHIFNFYYQYKQYKDCINNLKDDEACIHIDFSENFTCKYHQEIQAMHFIKEQITLHTGVIYIKGEPKPITFCSISPDNQHNPEAIWTHLDPVLQHIKINHPNISTLHFFSDGPTTQYRQKKNFYFFSQKTYEYGFSYGTWSFFEAAHGKGAADGIGGVIKRTLDAKIAQGKDTPNAETAFDVLSSDDTSIKVFYIKSIDILPIHTKLIPLQQTMKIHQLITKEKFQLKYRDLSCFCGDPRGNCKCHSPLHHSFLVPNKQKKDENVRRSHNYKKTKQRRINHSSTEEDDSEIDIEYADSDDTVIFSDDAMSLDDDYDLATVHNVLDEKTGILTTVNPNKKVTVLAEVIFKKADANTKAKQDKNKRILCEYEEFIPKRSRKTTYTHVPENENVTILSQIRNIPENTACGDLRDSNIFRKDNPLIDIKNKDSDSFNTDNKERDDNKENKNYTKEQKTLKTEDKIEKEYESEKIRFYTGDEDIKETRVSKITDKISFVKNNNIDFEYTAKCNEIDKTVLKEENEIGNLKQNKGDHKESSVDYEVERKVIDTGEERGGKIATVIERNEQKDEERAKRVKESEENEENDFNFNIKDNVLVRYFERKTWKYYVGFVEKIEFKNAENYYKIKFLKTVRSTNDSVKFLVQKKLDIDIVTAVSIVKKVNLIQRETDSKVYYLQNDDDNVFFT